MSGAQILHLDSKNENLNLALRLVYSFEEGNDVWVISHLQQRLRFDCEYEKLKPLIQFVQWRTIIVRELPHKYSPQKWKFRLPSTSLRRRPIRESRMNPAQQAEHRRRM